MTDLFGAMNDLKKCGKPDCLRKVKTSVAFCCEPCAVAANGRFEIHEHTAWCNERAAERGEYTVFEAQIFFESNTGTT